MVFQACFKSNYNYYKYLTIKKNVKYFSSPIKSGDILQVILCKPQFVVKKKKTVTNVRNLNWNGTNGGKSLLQISHIFKKYYIQLIRQSKNFLSDSKFNLKSNIKKYWKILSFVGRVFVCKSLFSKFNVRLFQKYSNVLVLFYLNLRSPNVLTVNRIKCSGKIFRRNNLKFLIANFKQKYRRLRPLRRMHRKKRKNK